MRLLLLLLLLLRLRGTHKGRSRRVGRRYRSRLIQALQQRSKSVTLGWGTALGWWSWLELSHRRAAGLTVLLHHLVHKHLMLVIESLLVEAKARHQLTHGRRRGTHVLVEGRRGHRRGGHVAHGTLLRVLLELEGLLLLETRRTLLRRRGGLTLRLVLLACLAATVEHVKERSVFTGHLGGASTRRLIEKGRGRVEGREEEAGRKGRKDGKGKQKGLGCSGRKGHHTAESLVALEPGTLDSEL